MRVRKGRNMASRSRGCRPGRWLAILAGACVLAAGAGPAGGREDLVYYQVIYTNRKIRDLANVPTTNEGIRRVVRISRVESPHSPAEVHSISAYGLGYSDPGRLVQKELHWDGKAWVYDPPEGRRPGLRAGKRGLTPAQTKRAAAVLGQKLAAERAALKTAGQAVVLAAKLLTDAADDDAKAAAMLLLTQAQAHRQETLSRVVRLEALLSAIAGKPVAAGAGAVTSAPAATTRPAGEAVVLDARADKRQVLPHRQQAWRLPAGRGRRTYRVSMAHPEAGRLGGFIYVAYADTDGDGVPDKLIARSPAAVAAEAGGRTEWQFTTDYETVFVGNAWRRADALQYHLPRPPADTGVAGVEVFVSGLARGIPRHRWTHPYLGNIRVRVADQNPE